jgi:glycerophosphoryl diester phosphodiesterase
VFDRSQFVRPIAHRGLHDAAAGRIENTLPAFEAALAGGYGIECDLQPAADATPMVFHDFRLDRLTSATGPIMGQSLPALRQARFPAAAGGEAVRIPTFGELLDLVAGRVPLLVEVKSDWSEADPDFLARIAAIASGYRGPLALMSFDPAVMLALRRLAPAIPRGIVAGSYKPVPGNAWYADVLGARERFLLRHLLRAIPTRPSFIAYHVAALPTLATTIARRLFGLPLFTWTVRTQADRAIAAREADAPIFEGYRP